MCRKCNTAFEGHFTVSRLGSLEQEHQDFITVFIKCRGNIKDVEKELGISYPTVRGRLDRAIKALGYAIENPAQKRKEILQALENKEMQPEDAIKAIKDLKD